MLQELALPALIIDTCIAAATPTGVNDDCWQLDLPFVILFFGQSVVFAVFCLEHILFLILCLWFVITDYVLF
jgi:hypothetical protein